MVGGGGSGVAIWGERHASWKLRSRPYVRAIDGNLPVVLLGVSVDSRARLLGQTRNVARTCSSRLVVTTRSAGATMCVPPDAWGGCGWAARSSKEGKMRGVQINLGFQGYGRKQVEVWRKHTSQGFI